MKKIDIEYVRDCFSTEITTAHYANAVDKVGLWGSEKIIFQKYFKESDQILDIGCGAGRTTMGLYELGYQSIEGFDLSEAMLKNATSIAAKKGYPIVWHLGDVTNIQFSDSTYDTAIFSFNGLEMLPSRSNRVKALSEIKRVLRPGGYLIFTTHDYDVRVKWDKPFWERERERWSNQEQDERLFEFGDVIAFEDVHDFGMYMHVAPRDATISCIEEAGLTLIEDRWRPEICDEREEVKAFSMECRFWVTQRPLV